MLWQLKRYFTGKISGNRCLHQRFEPVFHGLLRLGVKVKGPLPLVVRHEAVLSRLNGLVHFDSVTFQVDDALHAHSLQYHHTWVNTHLPSH